MRLVRFLFFISFGFFVFDLQGQTNSISSELNFSKYLFNKKYYDESISVLKNLTNNRGSGINPIQKDSIHYLLGNIYYNQQDLRNSITHFDSVKDGSHRMKVEAVFFSSFNQAYLKSYRIAEQKLLKYTPIDSTETQLRNLEIAGISLLQRDLKKYDSVSHYFSPPNYVIDQQEEKMKEHYRRITQQPKKSPLLAATLSAILPGAGKFYAGNRGQGMYTLLISTVLGLQAWEGYRKDGPSSFRFIAYGAIFSSIYIGTIWGSAFAVKFKRDQLNETINDQILFDMHIPLRTLFH